MNQLAAKTAIVTGGAVGIGHACAIHMAKKGDKVSIFNVPFAMGKALAARIVSNGTCRAR